MDSVLVDAIPGSVLPRSLVRGATTGNITVTAGQQVTDIDVGTESALGSISGHVFSDSLIVDNQNNNEPGVSDAMVRLLDGSGNVLSTTTMGINGAYTFDNLMAGDNQVEFIPLGGTEFVVQDIGIEATDPDADQSTGRTDTMTLGIGESRPDVDASVREIIEFGSI